MDEARVVAPRTELSTLRHLLGRRHSARAFLTDRVPRARIQDALELAGQSPSWCNTQPWHVVITEGEATERFRRALSAHVTHTPPEPDFPFPVRYAGEFRDRRLETALQLYDAVGVARGDRVASQLQTAKNYELFGAPHVAIITTEADLGVYGAIDCGIFTASFLLGLESQGVGAIPQAALASHSAFIREYFDLSDSRRVVCGVSFGWEDRDHAANSFRTSREPPESLITWAG